MATFMLASCSNESGTQSPSRESFESESTHATTSPTQDVTVVSPKVSSDFAESLISLKETYHAAIDPVLEVLNVSEYPASLKAVGWNALRKAHKMVGDIDETKLQRAANTLNAKYDVTDMTAEGQVRANIGPLQKQITQLKEDFGISPLDSLDQYLLPSRSALQEKRKDLGVNVTFRSTTLVETELGQRGFLLNVKLGKDDTIMDDVVLGEEPTQARLTAIERCMDHIIHQAFVRQYLHSLTPCEEVILFRPSDYPKMVPKLTENGGAPEK